MAETTDALIRAIHAHHIAPPATKPALAKMVEAARQERAQALAERLLGGKPEWYLKL